MKHEARFRPVVTVDDKKLAARCARGRVVIIDDDAEFLEALAALIDLEGYATETYSSALAYLRVLNYNRPSFPGPCCVLCDVRMPELDGLALQKRLVGLDDTPLLLMSGSAQVEDAIQAFRGGIQDFLIKPIEAEQLFTAIGKALDVSLTRQAQRGRDTDLSARVASLTEREFEIVYRVTHGETNPKIAEALGICLRTVKRHRQNAMAKMGAASTADLVRAATAYGI